MRLHRQISAALVSSALIGLAPLSARASIESVVAAVKGNEVLALEELSQSAPTAPQRTLAAGALLALRHEDARAIAMLIQVTRSTANPSVRVSAYLVLSDIYSRDQRYRACYSAIRMALNLSRASVNSGYRQAMAFAKALASVTPMQLVRNRPGSLPIMNEKAGMIRVPVEIDGHRRGVLIDTGASFSTISASVAKHSGVELLSRAATVGSSTEKAIAVHLGIAKRLQLGHALLKDVVFIVVPDSAWGIPRKFQVSAIVGMPVLMALGRLEFVNSGAPTLRYDVPRRNPATQERGAHSNMLLSGLEPFVIVHLPGASKSLRMELDTGANHTHFTHNAILDAPALFAHAERYVWHFAGMGGAVTERRALRLQEVPLTIGGETIPMKNVVVSSRVSTVSDGVIGADIFGHGARWTMDFKTMTLAVSK